VLRNPFCLDDLVETVSRAVSHSHDLDAAIALAMTVRGGALEQISGGWLSSVLRDS
jgi:hypothetical protein